MKSRYLLSTLIVLFLSATSQLAAEDNSASEVKREVRRPKIGLVLGGGGARGAAHIGLLKVLERERVPIDFISGTSMGAIVGGAYASGLSPEEIEEIFHGIDWANLLTDRPRRQDLSFRRKMDERRFTGFEFGIQNWSLKLPRGALAGRKLEFVLRYALRHTSELEHFDDLPIPFRAVATNIETGDAVVLKDGSLPLSIRASMSIPGAFSPVEINGMRLVDGYVSNNVPIDVMKKMGAELIIAVDVGTPLMSADEIQTFLDVVGQVSGIATLENVREQVALLGDNDLLIRPDLGDYTTTDFDKIPKIIPLGKEQAELYVEQIRRFSVSEKEYAVFAKTQEKQPAEAHDIEFIKISPTERVSEERIRRKLTIETGKPLDAEQLNHDLDRIYALGEFERVGIRPIREGDKRGILIEAEEKPWGPHYLRFGLNFDNDFRGDSNYGVLLEHRWTSLNRLGAEWQNSFLLGKDSFVMTEFYQPLDYADRFFIAPLGGFKQKMTDIYQDGNRIAEYEVQESGGGADLGFNLGTAAEGRAGMWWSYVDAEPNTGDADLPEFNVNRAQYRFSFTYDQVDNSNFPKDGMYAKAEAVIERRGLGADENFEKYEFTAAHPITIGLNTLSPRVSLGVNFDDDLPFYDEFTLGGAASFSGYRSDELRGKQKLAFRLMPYHQFSKQLVAFLRATYVGFAFDWGNVWDKESDIALDDLVFGGSVFFAADTVMGPLYLGVGMNDDQERAVVFLSFGQRM